jgi:preprotein translocase subunit YajC
MFATLALAAAPSTASSGAGGMAVFMQFFPLVLIAVVGYFLLLRPQQQRIKQQQAKLDAVRKGDSVVTAGGILGKVTKIEDQYVEVEIAPTVKVRVVKATLTDVTPLNGAKPAND